MENTHGRHVLFILLKRESWCDLIYLLSDNQSISIYTIVDIMYVYVE